APLTITKEATGHGQFSRYVVLSSPAGRAATNAHKLVYQLSGAKGVPTCYRTPADAPAQ
ncbi:TPA: hypothetical protein QDB35_006238, partial [Burkholderia vietnamiensis]|nr:hypothetical protein [Burkholderia vietnamiensis]